VTKDLWLEREFHYKLNHILALLLMLRIYIVIRVILSGSKYSTTRATRLGRMFGCRTGYQYTVKCLFRESPMVLICSVFISSIFFFSWALRVAEKPLSMTNKVY
jgi:hypothetical protein